ncbi:MAG: DUF3604 domain-containing protein, partial [Luminiphilus sp.]|nr:DUF3604 domain-containing protein [Luminiphilus sp.]
MVNIYTEVESMTAGEACKRRETFATSGPRIAPRFFGGWDLPTDICTSPQLATFGYNLGVPMGSLMPDRANPDSRPRFVVAASADPGTAKAPGHPLQRLQIIKG